MCRFLLSWYLDCLQILENFHYQTIYILLCYFSIVLYQKIVVSLCFTESQCLVLGVHKVIYKHTQCEIPFENVQNTIGRVGLGLYFWHHPCHLSIVKTALHPPSQLRKCSGQLPWQVTTDLNGLRYHY